MHPRHTASEPKDVSSVFAAIDDVWAVERIPNKAIKAGPAE